MRRGLAIVAVLPNPEIMTMVPVTFGGNRQRRQMINARIRAKISVIKRIPAGYRVSREKS